MLRTPVCSGMSELLYAACERAVLNAIPNVCLNHATDPIQYHILLGLACTAGSAFGYAPPSLSECCESFIQAHDKRDKQAVQMHRGGKAFTKHSHRDSSGWYVACYLTKEVLTDQLRISGGEYRPAQMPTKMQLQKLRMTGSGAMLAGVTYSGCLTEC